jgi:YegS/Rv2252/BmrU family lipid kinase
MPDQAVQLFLNPTAGRGRAGRRARRISELLCRYDEHFEMQLSTAVGDLEEQVRLSVEGGAQRIIVAGGDGSVHEAVNGIMRAGGTAALGVVPTGTGNDFAKAAGIPLDWQHAATLLADRIAANERTRPIDLGRMNGRYFANGAGIGLDAKVTRIARSYRLPIGDLVYLFAIFRTMLDGIASPHMRITTASGAREGPITLANVANGDWIGGMFNIAPDARHDDGTFDLVIVDPVSWPRVLKLLPKLMTGTHIGEMEISHERVTEVLIEADEPVECHLDGELLPPLQRFEISLLPGALQVL